MSLTSAFFDAELVGGEYDRVYSAERFAEYFAAFIANGVFPDPATNLQVVANVPSDMTVLVKSGLGWINGYYCNNDGNYPLTISPASGTLPRVDAVVLRWSRSNRSISLEVKTGVAISSPSAPPLERSADNYELMLASIKVEAGATSIAQANITDKRPDSSVCGWVKGVVDQIDTTDLFAQYDDAFQTWFDDIQAQLSGDVATNLQNQINQLKEVKLAKADQSTIRDVLDVVDSQTYTNPKVVGQLIKSITRAREVKITTSQSWVCPDGVYSVDAIIIGGGEGGTGGSGGSKTRKGGRGGYGGVVTYVKDIPVVPGTSYPIVIGAGGAGGAGSGSSGNGTAGSAGGSSSAFGHSSPGGSPTTYENTSGGYGGVGGLRGTGKLGSVYTPWSEYAKLPYGCGGGDGRGNGSNGEDGGGLNGGTGATWSGVSATNGGEGSGGGGGSGSPSGGYKGNGANGGPGGGGGGGGGFGVYSSDTYGGTGGDGGSGMVIIKY